MGTPQKFVNKLKTDIGNLSSMDCIFLGKTTCTCRSVNKKQLCVGFPAEFSPFSFKTKLRMSRKHNDIFVLLDISVWQKCVLKIEGLKNIS